MDRFFRQIIDQVKTTWARLTPIQRKTSIAGVILLLLFFAVIILLARRIEYFALYTDIPPTDAGKITAKLEEWKQPYKLDGTTIKVPAKDKNRLRVKLASENLAPTRGLVGYEIFDKVKWTETDFERGISYTRALQGEITQAIESIEQVEEAKVLLVMPKPELYVEEKEDATASVRLRLKPYATLEKNQVRGIVNLIASAVQGLKPENVTIVDSQGNILSEDLDRDREIETLTAHQLEIQRQEGKRLEEKIRKTLGTVLGGRDKAEVIVKWEMDFDRKESREERYSRPGFEQLMVSEEQEVEKFQGDGAPPGGAVGAEAQMPGYKGLVTRGPMAYIKEETRRNYVADKIETSRVFSPAIHKISVAVLVDGNYEYDEKGNLKRDEEGNPIYTPRSEEEIRKYEELVQAAIGFDKTREYEDREYIVRVENVQFDRSQQWLQEREELALVKRKTMMNIALGIVALLALGFIFFMVIMNRRAQARREEEIHRREMERLTAIREAEGRARETGALPPEVEEERGALEELRHRPEVTATLVRAALGEE
ncbi:TPA: flagellar M-ring protein FliF [bacterium]|nr:flagellar M-ring protein FliF [bacterium]